MADILIVEDDKAIARGLVTNLEYEGHRVRHVAEGDGVASLVATSPADLIILDVMLPGLNGFDVCRQVRRRDREVRILMLTARSEDVDKAMGLDLGADDYLTKPFSLTELLARIRALLRRAGNQSLRSLPAEVAFADITVDFGRFEATRLSEPVHLTAKEFALLQHLVAEQGCAVRRDALVDRVWGEDVNVTHRTVDTHVLSLRQKLEPDPANPRHILTVRGIGYRFVSSG